MCVCVPVKMVIDILMGTLVFLTKIRNPNKDCQLEGLVIMIWIHSNCYSKFQMVSQQSLVFLIKVPSVGILSGPPFENLCVCVCSCKGDLMNRSCSRKGDKNEAIYFEIRSLALNCRIY